MAASSAEMTNALEPEQQQGPRKKRRAERRDKLRKTAICKHYDKPGGCPFANCRFAHGRDEVEDGGNLTVAAQRELIREQVINRAEGRFEASDETENENQTTIHRGSMIERYYTELFACDVRGKAGEDQYVHMHSNRLCVIGVASTHSVMKEEIDRIEFPPSISDNKVSGKKKKGGQFLLPDTVLCHIYCKNGQEFVVRSCIRGVLLEVNDRLLETPGLLTEKGDSEGYLVIVQPKTVEVGEIQSSLLTKSEYKKLRDLK